ncbi:hypothetical protein MTO96_014852 [Rhipicephalus appendiculatus]
MAETSASRNSTERRTLLQRRPQRSKAPRRLADARPQMREARAALVCAFEGRPRDSRTPEANPTHPSSLHRAPSQRAAGAARFAVSGALHRRAERGSSRDCPVTERGGADSSVVPSVEEVVSRWPLLFERPG